MKITQEVRDFAAARAANSGFPGESRDLELAERSGAGGEDFAARQTGGANSGFPGESHSPDRSADTSLAAEEADNGMAEMSERFRAEGGEIYLPTAS